MIKHTPYYLADLNAFKSNSERLKNAISSYYSNYQLAYSLKTNYFEGFLQCAKEIGLFAEVVSLQEYQLAKNAGFTDSNIIWNGVLPSHESKLKCMECGGIVNVDNIDEFWHLFYQWRKNHDVYTPMPIGLRFELKSITQGKSRFGFSPDMCDKFNHMIGNGDIIVKCVHCHISNARDIDSFRIRVREMAVIAKRLGARIIDIGGNMYGPMHPDFAKQYESYIPSLEDYGLVIGNEIKRFFPNEEVLLVTENGTALVGSAMDLIATIIKKEVRGSTVVYALDCKKSDVGFSCNNKNPVIDTNDIPISCDNNSAIVYGCTCLERDIIHRDFRENLNIGQRIIIRNVGAYSYNVTNDFISPRPDIYISEY